MEQLDIQIKNVQVKLQQLLKQNQLLQKQHQALQKENATLKLQLDEKSELIAKLQQQVDVSKLNSTALDDKEKQALRKRIDLYLAEIEKCLVLINE